MWRSDAHRARGLAAALCLFSAALCGCVEQGIRDAMTPFDYAPLPTPEPTPPVEGAIWQGDKPSGSFLFFDAKARGVGDLVTVLIREDISAGTRASTGLSRSGSIENQLSSDVGISDLVSKAFRWFIGLFIDNPGIPTDPGDNVNVLTSENENTFEGDGETSREGAFDAVITCRVVDVLPGDVFHIRGRRSLLVNHEEQWLTLEALVRQQDISINNTVLSASLAEARMTFDGIGVVDDKQRPGWGARLMDWFYPF